MNKPVPSSSGLSLRAFVLTVLLGGLAFGTASYACAPVSQRLTMPITCPAGTVDSQVVTHVTRNNQGSVVTEFDFRCLDRDGGSTEPSGFFVLGALALYGMGVVLALLAVSTARRKLGLAAAATLAMTALSGCEFGTLTESEFEARYPYGSGPMFSTGAAESAGLALATQLGREPRVSSVTIAPEFVSFIVCSARSTRDRDVYTYRESGFGDPSPMQTSEREAPEDMSFALTPALLAKVAPIVRSAPRDVGIADAHVESVSFSRSPALEYHVDVESTHRRGTARYDETGRLIEGRID